MSIELPTTTRSPLTNSPTVLLLYGAPKVGKSSSIIRLNNNLVFDMESGGKLLSGLIIDVPQVARQENITPLDVLRR
jgi:GTPase SAR1 family protein